MRVSRGVVDCGLWIVLNFWGDMVIGYWGEGWRCTYVLG